MMTITIMIYFIISFILISYLLFRMRRINRYIYFVHKNSDIYFKKLNELINSHNLLVRIVNDVITKQNSFIDNFNNNVKNIVEDNIEDDEDDEDSDDLKKKNPNVENLDSEMMLDKILDKIKLEGIESLTLLEKNFLENLNGKL